MGVFNLAETVAPSCTVILQAPDVELDPEDWYYVGVRESWRFGDPSLLPSTFKIEQGLYINISGLVTDPIWDWSLRILSIYGFFAEDQSGDRGARLVMQQYEPPQPDDEDDFSRVATRDLFYQIVLPAAKNDYGLAVGTRPRPILLSDHSKPVTAGRTYLSFHLKQSSPGVLIGNGELTLEFSKQLKPRKL